MKLPTFKTIRKEDYPDKITEDVSFKGIIERIGFSVNNSIQTLVELANNKISLQDNVLCVVKTITIQVDTNGIPLNQTLIALGFVVQKAIGTQVINYVNNTDSNIKPTSGIQLGFTQIGSNVRIDHVAGLQAGYNYSLTVVVYG